MSFVVDMEKWRAATSSIYYKEWSDDAKAVLKDTGCWPERELNGDVFQTWSWSVYNPEAKRKHLDLLEFVLTKDGKLEYREPLLKRKPRQWWFVQEVANKTALLYWAFARNGFLKEAEDE